MENKEIEIVSTSYEEKIVPAGDEESFTQPMDTNVDEPQINYKGVKAMPYLIGNETFEKLGSIGTLANLMVYLTTVFNMKSITATTIISIFNGTTNLATLLGAYLSDAYFGRFKTLGFASVASFLGLFVIDLTAFLNSLHPPKCGPKDETCIGPTPFQLFVLLSGFGLMVIGAAGIRPCNLAFGADQFNPKSESGKRGINSFFNWYFFTLTFAQMISVTLVVYVQTNVSWSIGLAIPTLFMYISCVLFYMGSKIYVKVKPEGSPIKGVVQVIVAAFKKRQLRHPRQPSVSLFNYFPANSINSKLPYTEQFRFVDKAAFVTAEDKINKDGSPAEPWKLCSLQQVEAVKCLIRVLPIWACSIVYTIATAQQHQYVVFQALQSDRRLGTTGFHIPAASYIIFSMLSVTIFLPIYDRIIVPKLRRITGKEAGITILQRIGVGIFITVIVSFISALIEAKRRHLALTKPTLEIQPHRGPVSSMSALWLIPQLSLNGLAEAFTTVALVEFYYKQFPENMRSIGGSFYFCGMAAGNYVYGALLGIVHRNTEGTATGNWLPENLNKGRLDYFYYLITGLGVINAAAFLVCAKYMYKGIGEEESGVIEMETKQLD